MFYQLKKGAVRSLFINSKYITSHLFEKILRIFCDRALRTVFVIGAFQRFRGLQGRFGTSHFMVLWDSLIYFTLLSIVRLRNVICVEKKMKLLGELRRNPCLYKLKTADLKCFFNTFVKQFLWERLKETRISIKFLGASGRSLTPDFVFTRQMIPFPLYCIFRCFLWW